MKKQTFTRRDFLLGEIKQDPKGLHHSSQDAEIGLTPDISPDMAPELLAFEAERLGLDPEDREGVLQAIQKDMAHR
ncbi:MAG: hypothetical protein ACLFRC_10765 [Desulfonatronovibrionaceae bacterium]